MFLILYKKGENIDKGSMEFERPLTFHAANEMFLESVIRYKQFGNSIRIHYKIIETETGESILNSKFVVDREYPSLFSVLKSNSNIPKAVIDYITRVEKREIVENDDVTINDHVEEKLRLEQLKSEKNDILKKMKKSEKVRQQRDIDYQRQMQEIEQEKKTLEKALQLKEKEEAMKESQRIESLRQLEERKIQAMKLMEEKQNIDRQKKVEHEHRLKEVEEEAKKAELQLQGIEEELQKDKLNREKELQEIEATKEAVAQQAELLRAEHDKDEILHQKNILDLKETNNHVVEDINSSQSTVAIPELTLKEKIQELDFEAVKTISIRLVKSSAKSAIKGGKTTYKMMKNYHAKRSEAKAEKLKSLNRQVEINEKLAKEKIKYLEELKKDRLRQEQEMKKEAKRKSEEIIKQAKIEERYRNAKKKKLGHSPFYKTAFFKGTLTIILLLTVSLGSIYYFNLGDRFPVLTEVEEFMISPLGEKV